MYSLIEYGHVQYVLWYRQHLLKHAKGLIFFFSSLTPSEARI